MSDELVGCLQTKKPKKLQPGVCGSCGHVDQIGGERGNELSIGSPVQDREVLCCSSHWVSRLS